ncbi:MULTISPECIES: NUDIX domain-containing protein [unclassified Polaromonas]|uniref:NUDIX domain-containing protein n=1 Tax=unclassified Polaromonas TaxID=2638319 RepID=UPI0018CA8BBB|nr:MULTISPECIES: NUDIX hydrolase [unclassified Polaromonas]MBG6072442.1 ADP-ribose pyrophosphatase [Polaromonas sp. CG_9.7]MBG6114446.1 ADP-ribose pyrophosphatase [Polaromonas sp. CG_9.2]MDH6185397.1 ADP-ribose pyrophosphatase [Polaromonas sp. CG_23.6]
MTTEPNTQDSVAGDVSQLAEIKISSDEILAGNFLQICRDTVSLPDGRHTTREYVVHPGAVMIIALLDDGRVVLERQFRYPLHAVMVEFPAGKLDAGESSLACAKRELQEETGYTAREWVKAGVLHPAIAYSTEFIDIWFARGLTLGEQQLDSGEFLEVFSATPDELMKWCASGKVTDAKTLTGMLWLANMLSGAWTLQWQAAQP